MSRFAPTRRSRRRDLTALRLALAGLLCAGLASAEIYKWKDEQGRLHFAQDLSQVPAEYRSQAKQGQVKTGSGPQIQHYEGPPAARSPDPSRSSGRGSRKAGSQEVYRIPVERTGSTMKVNVRLNDQVTAPFFIDTGASDVLLPEWVARDLGLDLENGRTAFYGTANGVVQQHLVTLDSVDLGGARAEKIPAAVSASMSVGLLGLSFFNHFRYDFDPGSGIVTLRPNGLAEAGQIRGGRSEPQWRSQFDALARRRRAVEKAIDAANPNASLRKGELDAALEEVDRQIQLLEDEADDARVPMQWRD
jgi:clan AA aspartic protease (TIGR02281 family)